MSNALTTIPFHGASLIAIPGDTPEKTLIAMKPMVEGMTLVWEGQRKKLSDHPVLATCTTVKVVQMPGEDQSREHTFLPLNRIHFWLATLHPKRFDDLAVRERVITYQNEAADALFDHFFGKAIGAKPVDQNKIGRQVAAILDDKLARLVETMLPQMIDDRLAADPRSVATTYRPALDILIEKNVPSRRRRAFSQKVSSRLRRYSTKHCHPMRISRETGRYLFHVDAIGGWMRDEGQGLIASHVAAVSGQGVLPFKRTGPA